MMMYMTSEQEDRIIRDARDILERRMAVEKDIKVNLQNLVQYGAYLMGALDVAKTIISYVNWNAKGDERVYRDAELALITKSKRTMQLFLDGCDVRYRNWKRNKKGKLESCEAYFVERRMVTQKVK